MTTLARKMRRAKARKTGTDWPVREQPHRDSARGLAYDTLHPTKGWKRVSARRLRAQNRLRALIERILARRNVLPRKLAA